MTDPNSKPYTGRFAPSPTGPLHFGSLYCALASFLDARSHSGRWLLRIDDLDTPRNVDGSAQQIIHDLEIFGLHWDGRIVYQSEHLSHYHQTISQWLDEQKVYPCTCSRKRLQSVLPDPSIYPGFCRLNPPSIEKPAALRLITDDIWVSFEDHLQGNIAQNLARDIGDFVVLRKDKIVAYQLAVVIDDHRQGVTDVVRGFDLLDSTPKQIFIQRLLGFAQPNYMHIPVIVDNQGFKLSKQTFAQAIDTKKPSETLFHLLKLLKQHPPAGLDQASIDEILTWGTAHWKPERLKKIRAIQ